MGGLRWYQVVILASLFLNWGLPFAVAGFKIATGHRHVPLPTDPTVPIVLQARLFTSGRWWPRSRSTSYGTVRLEDGWFYWDPEVGERWAVDVREILVRQSIGWFGGFPRVRLAIRGRDWWLTVADRRINRYFRSYLHEYDQARRTREFVDRMLRSMAFHAARP